jgi:hypothetical protein
LISDIMLPSTREAIGEAKTIWQGMLFVKPMSQVIVIGVAVAFGIIVGRKRLMDVNINADPKNFALEWR